MKTLLPLALAGMLASSQGIAQKLDTHLDLTALDSIATKAAEKTELSLEGSALDFLKQIVSNAAPDRRELFAGINSITVRSYQFDKAGQFMDRDLDDLRKQVSPGSGWSRMLNSKDSGGHTEIYTFARQDRISGLLLISTEAMELTVVQIGGTVELARIQELIQSTIRFTGAQ